jgi:hypothetical protein
MKIFLKISFNKIYNTKNIFIYEKLGTQTHTHTYYEIKILNLDKV